MKVIIAGSRGISSMHLLNETMKDLNWEITEVVSGKAKGPDKLGEIWAIRRGIKVKDFPADWDGLGKSAGYVRNKQMAEYADACVVLWDGVSKGSKHMIDLALSQGLKVYVRVFKHDSFSKRLAEVSRSSDSLRDEERVVSQSSRDLLPDGDREQRFSSVFAGS